VRPRSHAADVQNLDRQVDADKHRELGTRFDVKGFPTILYFSRGKPVESHQPCVLPSAFQNISVCVQTSHVMSSLGRFVYLVVVAEADASELKGHGHADTGLPAPVQVSGRPHLLGLFGVHSEAAGE
jgi:hypothetical protein